MRRSVHQAHRKSALRMHRIYCGEIRLSNFGLYRAEFCQVSGIAYHCLKSSRQFTRHSKQRDLLEEGVKALKKSTG